MNEAEEFGEPEKSSFPSEAPQISGIGLVQEEESDEETTAALEELLSLVNSTSEKELADNLKKQEEERKRYQEEEEKRIAEATERYNKERYEKERAAKAERLREENEKALEKQKEKENSFLSKAGAFVKNGIDAVSKIKPVKKKAPEPEIKQDIIPPATEEEEISVEESVSIEDMLPEDIPDEIEDIIQEEEAPEELLKETPEELLEETIEESPEESLAVPEEEEHSVISEKEPTVTAEEELSATTEKEPPAAAENTPKKRSLIGDAVSFIKKKGQKRDTAPSKIKDEEPGEPDWKFIATHDEMTGLLNTRAYAEDLKTISKSAGVVFFDINNLKHTNDNFSHEAGNRLIKGVTASLKKHFGEEHLYRTGGDEFICLIPKVNKQTPDKINDAMGFVHSDMKDLTKKDPEKIIYAVSIGYAIGDGKHEIEEVVKAADAAMYKNKRAYKQAHPELAARPEDKITGTDSAPAAPANYDDGLKDEQKQLKNKVRENHMVVSATSTRQLVRELQSKADQVRGILIASPTFDHLFIITDVDAFVDLILSENELIDYSYFYVIYDGGPQYYGADEYYSEVTHLFEDISNGILSGKIKSEKDIKSIKGINIFKNIYV